MTPIHTDELEEKNNIYKTLKEEAKHYVISGMKPDMFYSGKEITEIAISGMPAIINSISEFGDIKFLDHEKEELYSRITQDVIADICKDRAIMKEEDLATKETLYCIGIKKRPYRISGSSARHLKYKRIIG